MNNRIAKLVDKVKKEDIFAVPVSVSYDEFDEKLPEPVRIAKRLSEYMDAQPVMIHDESELVQLMRFDGTVEADIFPRIGHEKIGEAFERYYCKPQENLCVMEWQHSNADFGKIIRRGLCGLREDIIQSRKNYLNEPEHLNFLAALEITINGIYQRARNCAAACRAKARETTDAARKATLLRMAKNCETVPMRPAQNFEQAVQCVYFCFIFLADSIGRPDQYLYQLYKQGIGDGTLTKEHARELLQELFCMIHSYTPPTSCNTDKGAESHFSIGGYTIDHKDGFNELSELILDSMMECDLIRPQLSLRWTKLTPRSVLYKVLDCERKDKNKRIAIANDEPRIDALLKINKVPWETAYDYIMVGCNEPAFQGGISLGGETVNIVRSLVNTLNKRRDDILETSDFNGFYSIFEQELINDIERIIEYVNRFNMLRSRDCNVLSSLFLDGCIERAQSCTRGGAARARVCANFMGGTNLIDSLCIIRQFIYEEKRTTLTDLLDALDKDWHGYEDLRVSILKNGKFYGNNDDFSESMAQRFYRSVYRIVEGRTDYFGHVITFGNLTGYHPHFATFGALTQATPDGRVAGSALLFGSGQNDGKDKCGITEQLLSIAHMDPTGIMCGNTITNLSVDEDAVQNEESFEKLVILLETYFREGGLHVQLNHISRETLLAAKANPQDYKSLRVRVSGFSAYFVGLREQIQNNVIERTEHKV